MSTQPLDNPEPDESKLQLILGRPGGGKGTISKKILEVSRQVDEKEFRIGVKMDPLTMDIRRTFPFFITSLRETCSAST